MKRYCVLFLFLLQLMLLNATDNFNIVFSCSDLPYATVDLRMYVNGREVVLDTLIANAKGEVIFNDVRKKAQGIYFFRLNNKFDYDILIGDQQSFTIVVDTAELLVGARIEGAAETEKFSEYKKELYLNKRVKDEWRKRKDTVSEKQYSDSLQRIDAMVRKYLDELINDYKGSFLSDFIKATLPPENPGEKTFFDNIALSEPRLWNTPYLPAKIDQWLKIYLIGDIEALRSKVDWLMQKVETDSVCTSFMLERILLYTEASRDIHMENLRYYIDQHYIQGENIRIDNNEVLQHLQEEMERVRYCRIGQQAIPLRLKNMDNSSFSTDAVHTPWLILFFYEPGCAYCNLAVPFLYERIYKRFHSEGLEVVAICMNDRGEEWKSFIEKYNCTDWINVWDPDMESQFWIYYDTKHTPSTYLVGPDRKIVLKNVEMKTFETEIENLLLNNKK